MRSIARACIRERQRVSVSAALRGVQCTCVDIISRVISVSADFFFKFDFRVFKKKKILTSIAHVRIKSC